MVLCQKVAPNRIIQVELTDMNIKEENALDLVSLYQLMFRARRFAGSALPLKRQGLIGTYPSLEGQEAIDAALASAMLPEDLLLFSYRKDGYLLDRGVPPEQIYQYWGGDERGSMFPKTSGAYPFSIPIGTHATHAAGIAYSMKLRKKKSVVVCIVGDGGSSKGDFYGAMNYAMLFSLPIVFVIENNHWAISTPREYQSRAETLAQKGLAVGFPEDRCIVVDGNNVRKLRHAFSQAVRIAREDLGPSVVEALTYRLADHTTVDNAAAYRDPGLVAEARKFDPIMRLRSYLEKLGAWDGEKERVLSQNTEQWIKRAIDRYLAISPPLVSDCFTYHYAALPPHLAEQGADAEKWHEIVQAETKARHGETGERRQEKSAMKGSEGSAIGIPEETGKTEGITMVEAVNRALHYEMERDPFLVVAGQDVGRSGGVFRATAGLYDLYDRRRVMDVPLDELSLAGFAAGYATQGNRIVVEAQFSGFIHPMMDQIMNHMARFRNRTRGMITCPIVIRAPWGGGIGSPEHHSECVEALFAHIPGLKVVIPSSPERAYRLLLAAIRDPDPVLFFEPTALYRKFREEFPHDGEAVSIGQSFVLREGENVTIVAYGGVVHESLEAAEVLLEEGISAEVIDVATLSPLDMGTILRSVEKTGRCVIVHEAPKTYGCGAEIAAEIAEKGLFALFAPVLRVTGYDIIPPLAKMEAFNRPTTARIAWAVKETLQY